MVAMKLQGKVHYENWKPTNVKGREVWVRFKPGEAEKPAIIMTHSPMISGTQLNPLFEALRSHGGRMLAIELPGQGRSERIGLRQSVFDYANEVLEISSSALGNFKTENCIFMGHCYGGDIMHTIALRNKVAGAIALNLFPTAEISEIAQFALKGMGNMAERRLEQGRDGKSTLPGRVVDDIITIARHAGGAAKTLFSTLELLRTWHTRVYGRQEGGAPFLAMTGEHDVWCPAERLMEFTRGHAIVKVIGDADHFMHLRRPREVAKAVLEFLARKEGAIAQAR